MRKILEFFIGFLLLGCPALTWAQGGVPVEPVKVIDTQGRPRGGVLITFCQNPATGIPCSNLATIYSDSALTIPINQGTNPLHTDGSGNFPVFYVAPGVYQYTVTGVGITNTGQPFTATVAGTGGGDVTTTTAQTITGQKTFSQPIVSTVATGTAPLTIASTTVVPNLNAQLHNGLAAPASAIVGISDAQALTSKTFDISLNTLKTATNTAGHVPRNNGTQYVDAQLGFADLTGTASTSQIGTGTPAAGKYVDGGTGNWTPIPASGVSEATWSASNANSPGTFVLNAQMGGTVFPSAHTLIRYTIFMSATISGCTASPAFAFRDSTGSTNLSTLTITNGTSLIDSGAISVAMTAGHTFVFQDTTAGSGCTGGASGWTATVFFQ